MSAMLTTAEEVAEAATRRIRRLVNDAIYSAALQHGGDDLTVCHFMCECGQLSCSETVALPAGSFGSASLPGDVTAHGH
jgi:hypothetical protein